MAFYLDFSGFWIQTSEPTWVLKKMKTNETPRNEAEEAQILNHFDGPDYVPERDCKRLTSQLHRVKNAMLSGEWKTLSQLEAEIGSPQSSISARLRDLRKERFGGYIVERKYESNGLFCYRILLETKP